jgi:hypothetical protein
MEEDSPGRLAIKPPSFPLLAPVAFAVDINMLYDVEYLGIATDSRVHETFFPMKFIWAAA